MNTFRIVSIALFLCIISSLIFYFHPEAKAQSVPRIAVIGDDFSDEYQANDQRGGQYADKTMNWLELLVKSGRVSAGNWGNYNETRRTGYELNFARTGALAKDVIDNGQHTGVRTQIRNSTVDVVVIMVGLHDFSWQRNNGYKFYYDGPTEDQINSRTNAIFTNIQTAIDTVKNAGNAKVIVVTIPDPSEMPPVIKDFPNENKRYEVSDIIYDLNSEIEDYAYDHDVEVMYGEDFFYAIDDEVFPAEDALVMGQEVINYSQPSDEPHHIFLGDGYHFSTIGQSFFANLMIDSLNDVLGTEIESMDEDEILSYIGIAPEATFTPTPTTVPATATPTQPPATATVTQPPATFTVTPTNPPGITDTPTPTPSSGSSDACKADINQDSVTDLTDLSILVANFFSPNPTNPRADITGNGVIDLADYTILLREFFQPCVE